MAKTRDRELCSPEYIDDNFPKYLVMPEPGIYEGVTDRGIICCSLENFLKKEI
jgi:hypothetical protein